ncbi:tRNA uridine-5-carboxymethylaminomethyl(34) synthesis GTPase MnmE [bacterium]|nr:tRNA uridine-5-carboxymethylaminomethyl(34) synthesis GTPase MnmE [bacterium]
MYFQRLNQTIVALASSEGSSIGIIRISGDEAISLALQLTGKRQFTPFKATLSVIFDKKKEPIDEAIVIAFPAPHSYTGEDVVELHVHGASLHAKKIVDYIISLGAYHARAGEFSYRSIINGKRTLTDVSVIDELISTESEMALSYQRKELVHHNISTLLEELEERWFNLRAVATALIDFPEDVDENIPPNTLKKVLDETKNAIKPIYENSLKLREYQGLRVVIAGRPNAGKSTLFNTLLKRKRAIVTEVAGTTRDFITETISLDNHMITLVDTAGIRESNDAIEKEGVTRATEQIKAAHIVLHLIDANLGWTEDNDKIQEGFNSDDTIYLLTKIDLLTSLPSLPYDAVPISLKTGAGVDKLIAQLSQLLNNRAPAANLPAMTSQWQLELFETLLSQLEFFDTTRNEDVGLFFYHIKNIHDTFLSLLGKEMRDDIHEKIFSSFCIGK